jgi:predicted acyl esterase
MYGADRVAETAKFWTGKGYAVLLQNIRGRHGSEGGPVVRARFRNGLDNPALIKRGEVYRYEIDLWSTSNVFLLGHSIALAISSSNFPRINRNLNTGGDNEQDSDFITEDQTVFHNSRYSSHLILPVIEFPGQIFHE